MSGRGMMILVVVVVPSVPVHGDQLLYQYEGDVLPYDAAAGWEIFNPCDGPCSESLVNGRFRLDWLDGGNFANYNLTIAQPPNAPPPTLWVEWRFRSDDPRPFGNFGCDGKFRVTYGEMLEIVFMHGDSAVSISGADFVNGLPLGEFHTYRYESLDGINYRIAVEGQTFIDSAQTGANQVHHLQFGGSGGCDLDLFPNFNEWDFVRYGEISFGEQIIAADPPAGYLDPVQFSGMDRFTVTFDSPNYVYIDDITVEVTGGDLPVVTATHRTDTGGPDTVEIVLDRPIPDGEATRFIFNDGVTTNEVRYTFRQEPIPAASHWGVALAALLVLIAGSRVFGRHMATQAWAMPPDTVK